MTWFDTSIRDLQELPVMAANGEDSNGPWKVHCRHVCQSPLRRGVFVGLPQIGRTPSPIHVMRKYSGKALEEFSSAGAFAPEVLTGINTIASLRAEMWAVKRHTDHVVDAQKNTVKSQAYSKLASGIMRLIFHDHSFASTNRLKIRAPIGVQSWFAQSNLGTHLPMHHLRFVSVSMPRQPRVWNTDHAICCQLTRRQYCSLQQFRSLPTAFSTGFGPYSFRKVHNALHTPVQINTEALIRNF